MNILQHSMARITACAFALALLFPVDELPAQETPYGRLSNTELRDALARPDARALPRLKDGAGFDGEKCRLPLVMEAWSRVRRGEGAGIEELRGVLARPNLQTSILSAQGRFLVHYDTAGVNTPAVLDASGQRINGTAHVYADSVARFFERAYASEVEEQGYETPPIENGATAYQVYIVEEFGSVYGETVPVHPVSGGAVMPLTTTYIELDNDFREYPTKGLNGARVTAAHEFHHAVQLGIYGWWASDLFMYEMTSTCMEDIVYPAVNDYLYYLPDFFKTPSSSLYSWRGYQAVLFPLRIYEMIGPATWREVWTVIKQQAPIAAMRTVFNGHGTDLASEFCDFSRWVYRSGYRSGSTDAPEFIDARLFPAVSLYSVLPVIGGQAVFNSSLPPLGSDYLRAVDGVDTLTISVSNIDEQMAEDKSSTRIAYRLTVARGGQDASYTQLSNGWSYRFEPGVPGSLCVNAYEQTAVAEVTSSGPYPNPFIPQRDGLVRFPVERMNNVDKADLYIHSTGMTLVRKLEGTDIRHDETFGSHVSWDGSSDRGDAAPSGVYFYTVVYGGKQHTGKLALIRR